VDRADPGGRAVQDLAVPGLGDRVDLVVLALVPDRAVRVVLALAVMGRVDLVVPHLVGLADIRDLVGLADIRDPAGLAGRADLGRADLVGPVVLGRVRPVDQGMDRVGLAGLAARADLGRVDLVVPHPVGLADIRDPMERAHLAARVDLDLVGRVDLGDQGTGLADRVDRHRRRTRQGVLSNAVAPRWAAPGMHRMASAHPVTVRRLRPHNTDGAGMAGHRPERRRLSGTDRRPQVAGTVHRRPVVGTAHGMVRRVT
jgi:hypothetical protein